MKSINKKERQILEAQKLVEESIDSVEKGEKCYSLSESKELIENLLQNRKRN